MKYTDEATYNSKGKDIVFKYVKNPSLVDKMSIVDDIVNGVVNDTIGYEPILFGYFTVVSFVENVTNIELPKSFSESAKFIDTCEIENVLYECIPASIFDEVIDAAKKKIEFNKAKITNSSKLDDLFGALTTLAVKYTETFDGVDMEDLFDKLSRLSEIVKMPKEDIVNGILKFEEYKNKTQIESE